MLSDTLMQSALDVAAAAGVEEAAQDAVFARINADAPDLRSRIAGMEEAEWDRTNCGDQFE